jgi:hypothetical protein
MGIGEIRWNTTEILVRRAGYTKERNFISLFNVDDIPLRESERGSESVSFHHLLFSSSLRRKEKLYCLCGFFAYPIHIL